MKTPLLLFFRGGGRSTTASASSPTSASTHASFGSGDDPNWSSPALTVTREGRGKPVTVFAPGHGRAVEVTQQWVGPLGIGGTRLFFEYEHSGHFDATKGLRRQADRDAAETAAVIGQRLDRGHPLEVAEQWAYALRARLEIFPADGLLWTAHRPRFAAVLSDFLDVG